MSCDAIGTFKGEPKDFVSYVLQQDTDGACQNVRVGVDSPGPVKDIEAVARFVFCPAHVNRSQGTLGAVDETLFIDVLTIGGSINRLVETNNDITETLHSRGEDTAEGVRTGANGRPPQPDRQYLGAVRLIAGDVRAIAFDTVPNRVRIYDTSLGPEDPLHGDIVVNTNGLTKTNRKELRVRLFMLAQRSGLFVSHLYAGPYDLNNCGLSLN
jgi:hypothetical protein